MKRNSPFPKKFADFCVTLDNFLLPILDDSFPILYQELNTVRSENSELSHGILHFLPVFGEIIVYLCKMVVDLKNINYGKISYYGN